MVDEKSKRPVHPFVEPVSSDPPVVAPRAFRTVLAADEMDPPDSDIYTHGPYQYPYAADAYFLFPMTYQHFRKGESPAHNDGLNDCQFCASRDGIHWMRYDRKPYIERGMPGEPDCGQANASWGAHFRQGNALVQYYGGWPWTHVGFRRLTAADAPYTGGELTTPGLVSAGKHLEINVNVAAMGEARIEIQDASGIALPGYTLSDCDRVIFNDPGFTVKWRGNADEGALADRPVRLRFALRSAKCIRSSLCRNDSLSIAGHPATVGCQRLTWIRRIGRGMIGGAA